MDGFEMWKQDKHNMKYHDTEIIIVLQVKDELQTTNISKNDDETYRYIGWNVSKVYVVMAEPPKEYCGGCKILEKSDFGVYSEESYQEAVTYFKTLVANHI